MTDHDAQTALRLAPLGLEQFEGHTPGEFLFGMSGDGPYVYFVDDHGEKYTLAICGYGLGYGDTAEDSANFRLFAASPRLLDELRRTREERDALRDEQTVLADALHEKINQYRTALKDAIDAIVRITAMLDLDTWGDSCDGCGGTGDTDGRPEAGTCEPCGGGGCKYGFLRDAFENGQAALND